MKMELMPNITQLPEHLKVSSRGEKQQYVQKVLHTLRSLASDKCLTWAVEEYKKEVGAYGNYLLKSEAKKLGYNLRVANDNGKVHVWIKSKIG